MKYNLGKAYVLLFAFPSLIFIASKSVALLFLIATGIAFSYLFSKLKLAFRISSFRNIFIFDAISVNSFGFFIEYFRTNDEYIGALLLFGFIPWMIITSLWKANSKGYKQAKQILGI